MGFLLLHYYFCFVDKRLPESLRPYIYGLYSNTYGVNLSEAAEEDFKSYPSLADFFAR